jgi:site-specific recombinase XerD
VTGKGSRVRWVPIGKKAVAALDRYLRAWASHRKAEEPWLWLGQRGRMTVAGIAHVVETRAQEAGIGHVNPHRFRHSFAHHWLSAGGQETDVEQIAGWSSPTMIRRYGASAAAERAREAHRRFGPGDRL